MKQGVEGGGGGGGRSGGGRGRGGTAEVHPTGDAAVWTVGA